MYYRRRKRKSFFYRYRIWLLGGGAAALALVVALIAVLTRAGTDRTEDDALMAMSRVTLPPMMEASAEPESVPVSEATFVPTAEPTQLPTPEPVQSRVNSRAGNRPEAEEGFLPVFRHADTDEKIIAITVDDCFQADNLEQIIQLALDYDGKLTIFPIGEQTMRSKQAQILKAAWEAGMELENHTYTHNGLYRCTDERLAKEIYMQNYALSYILGGQYECHFLRPMGGDARNDQRIHAYINQLGYRGIAHWSKSGSSQKQLKEVTSGDIYLFHTTDTDLEILRKFIPAVAAMGYRMVTLNEMFGYEDNAFTPMEIPKVMPEIPQLEPYETVLVELDKGTYAYAVLTLQARLKELGYQDGKPDGIYGDGTVEAVKAFQRKAGLKADGIAGVETQTAIYAQDAPRK